MKKLLKMLMWYWNSASGWFHVIFNRKHLLALRNTIALCILIVHWVHSV